MKREKGFEVPFAVMRQIGTSMEDQLVSGFTRVIRSGAYADGTALPGIRKLAVMFGVSEITVRNAVKRLCRDGLLAARPRVGLTVCAPGGRSWHGTVLGIKAGPPGMYFASVIESTMEDVLRENGWLYSSVSLSSGRADFATCDLLLTPAVSFAVTFDATAEITRRVERSGLRFAEVCPHRDSPRAQFSFGRQDEAQVIELGEALRSAGVKTVLSVHQHRAVANSYSSTLKRMGLSVRNMRIRPVGGRNTQECVQRAGLVAFERMLSSGGIREDAVVCNDDYLAAGILSAFDRHGIHMPDDVCFATMANKGLGPVHVKELTRIELDPWRFGLEFGKCVVSFLETGVPRSGVLDVARFCRGETI